MHCSDPQGLCALHFSDPNTMLIGSRCFQSEGMEYLEGKPPLLISKAPVFHGNCLLKLTSLYKIVKVSMSKNEKLDRAKAIPLLKIPYL